MSKKKILAGKAIAALLLASSFSVSADAASNLDIKDVYSARGGCAGAKQGCAAATPRGSSCAAATSDQTAPKNAQQLPKQTPNGQPTTPNKPQHSSCAAYSQPRPASSCAVRQVRSTNSCAATYSDNSSSMTHVNPPASNQMRRDANQRPQNSGTTSTYQGTTTGPGPNGGYPETPRGTYPIQPGSRN